MEQVSPQHPIEILLVDDSPGDVILTRTAFAEANIANRLSAVGDGEQALKFLRRQPPFEDAPRPDLVLLDLNMPRMNGHEVLAEVKADPKLKVIPIIVLTTSEAEKDICVSYELHANCFIQKPVDYNEFLKVVKAVEEFWRCGVRLPSESKE